MQNSHFCHSRDASPTETFGDDNLFARASENIKFNIQFNSRLFMPGEYAKNTAVHWLKPYTNSDQGGVMRSNLLTFSMSLREKK